MTAADRFEAFVREYQDMVYGTAVRLVGKPADAEDIAQTVFLRAFERFDDIGENPSVPGWLKTVTTNLCLNHLSRYRSRWRFFSEMDQTARRDRDNVGGDAELYASTIAVPASALDNLERADRDARLERAVRQLPDHQRVPLVLFHFEDMRYEDIAATLGISLGKVKTDIHRGREALRNALGSSDGPR